MSFSYRTLRPTSRADVIEKIWVAAIAALLILSLTEGGSGAELLSVPVLAIGLFRLAGAAWCRAYALPMAIAAAMLALPMLQLIPLPPEIWSALPGRGFALAQFEALHLETRWLPLSLSPELTLRAALGLLPALALFCALLTLPLSRRDGFVGLLALLSLLSALVGIRQALEAGGIWTQTVSVSGFFTNRNHFSALLYATLPFLVVLSFGHSSSPRLSLRSLFCGGAILLLMSAIVLSGSRTGFALGLAAILAFPAATLLTRKTGSPARSIPIYGALAIVLALLVVVNFSRSDLLIERLDLNPFEDLRVSIMRTGLQATADVFPAGVGFGAFSDYFRIYIDRSNIVAWNINEMHNDWLQIVMEGGLPAVLIAATFLLWFARRILALWRADPSDVGLSRFARAASFSMILLMAHAAVEYHFRQIAIQALFALCAALVLPGADGKGRPVKTARR